MPFLRKRRDFRESKAKVKPMQKIIDEVIDEMDS